MSQAALTMIATEIGISEKGNPLKTADRILDEFEKLQARVVKLEAAIREVESTPGEDKWHALFKLFHMVPDQRGEEEPSGDIEKK